MPLPSFTVTGDLFNIIGDVAGSELTAPNLTGSITFTPNVSSSEFVKWEGDLYRVAPVTGRISVSGVTRNGLPLELLANDTGLSVTGLQWHVEISVKPDPGTGIARPMKDFWFNAPADGATIDLASVAPVPNVSVTGVFDVPSNSVGWDELNASGTPSSTTFLKVAADGSLSAADPGSSADEYHEYANLGAFPTTGVTDRQYLAVDTGKAYRWNGTTYVQIAGTSVTDNGDGTATA